MVKQSTTGINRVAIIGGGPTGIACAKYLLAEKSFQVVHIFEQRNNVGGIWNLSGVEKTKRIPIPQTDPRYGAGWSSATSSTGKNDSLEFESPLYDYLETNIPKTLMAYSDMPFAERLPLFPRHADVLRYLEEYAEPLRPLIRFHTRVVEVKPLDPPNPLRLAGRWLLTTKDLQSNAFKEAQYDAIIVANGHYTVPHVPAIPGIAEWHKKYPDIIMHSKAYRRPEDFSDKKVLVVGNSASGLDIAGQLAPCAQQPVYLTSRSPSQLAPAGGGPAWRRDIPEIQEFLVNEGDRAVRTKGGEVFEGFDAIIFATGYFYSFPFISSVSPASPSSSKTQSPSGSSTSLDSPAPAQDEATVNHATLEMKRSSASYPLTYLTSSGLRTHDVYKHFLHISYPTLAFPVLNLKVIPFPLAENQAAVIARLWSGRLDLPQRIDMRKWEQDEERRLLEAHRLRPALKTASNDSVAVNEPDQAATKLKYEGGFHTLVYPEDAAQINSLYQWAASARRRDDLENNGSGKLGTKWDEEQVWLRKQFPNIKAAYAKLGSKRFEVTSLEELGEEWKNGFEKWKEETTAEEKADLFKRAAITEPWGPLG